MKNYGTVLPPAYSPEILSEACRLCNISESDYEHLLSVAKKIASDKDLTIYACTLYKEFTEGCSSFSNHYRPEDKLGIDADHIFLLTVLSGMPTAYERYLAQGTPEDIIAATLDFTNNTRKNPPAGETAVKILPLQLAYCRRYYKAEIFRLGRFHFTLSRDKRDLPIVLINKKDPAQKILLSADQTFYDDKNFVNNEKPTWLTRASLDEKAISGHLINADGTASRERTEFATAEWSWQAGARMVIDMHIPSGGGMTPDLSRESLKKAFAFFAGKSALIYCNSWIFNPELQGLAGADNITALMKMGHLFPVKSPGQEGMFFLYGKHTEDLSELPADTTLRRSVLEYLTKGGRMRNGGVFFFADEFR